MVLVENGSGNLHCQIKYVREGHASLSLSVHTLQGLSKWIDRLGFMQICCLVLSCQWKNHSVQPMRAAHSTVLHWTNPSWSKKREDW